MKKLLFVLLYADFYYIMTLDLTAGFQYFQEILIASLHGSDIKPFCYRVNIYYIRTKGYAVKFRLFAQEQSARHPSMTRQNLKLLYGELTVDTYHYRTEI